MHEERDKRRAQEYDTLLMGGARPTHGDAAGQDKTQLASNALSATQQSFGATALGTSALAQLPTTKADITLTKHADVMHQSSRNIDELSELHALIDEETGNQLGKHSGATKDTFLDDVMEMSDAADLAGLRGGATASGKTGGNAAASAAAAPSPVRRGTDILQRDTKKSAAGLPTIPESNKMVSEGVASDDLLGGNRPLTTVERENLLLRREIASFDEEFWEQLEDLKHRYARLQEIVGETPAIPPDLSTAQPPHDGSRGILMSTLKEDSQEYLNQVSQGHGSLPLDKLAWSVRNSMTAMDRAGLTSPLVARPRSAHAYTYAPGATRGVGSSVTPSGIAAKYSTYGGGEFLFS